MRPRPEAPSSVRAASSSRQSTWLQVDRRRSGSTPAGPRRRPRSPPARWNRSRRSAGRRARARAAPPRSAPAASRRARAGRRRCVASARRDRAAVSPSPEQGASIAACRSTGRTAGAWRRCATIGMRARRDARERCGQQRDAPDAQVVGHESRASGRQPRPHRQALAARGRTGVQHATLADGARDDADRCDASSWHTRNQPAGRQRRRRSAIPPATKRVGAPSASAASAIAADRERGRRPPLRPAPDPRRVGHTVTSAGVLS